MAAVEVAATPEQGRPPTRLANRRLLLSIAIATLLALALGAPSLLYPFGRDQGEYAYIATAALQGKTVYREVFNVKPPLTHMLHALALLAFGRSMQAIRILDLLWQAVTSVFLLLVARSAYRRHWVGVLAALIYVVLYFSNTYWDTAQTDGFQSLFLAMSVWLFLRAQARGHIVAYAASGIAIGGAILLKYPVGLLLPLLAILALARPGHRLRGLVGLAVGAALPLTSCALYLACQGAWRDFVFIQTTYIPAYTAAGRLDLSFLRSAIGKLFVPLWHNITVWMSALLAMPIELAVARRRGRLATSSPIIAWWVTALVSLIIQNKGGAYHALPFLAPHALLVAHTWTLAWERFRARSKLRLLGLIGAEFLLLAPVLFFLSCGYPFGPDTLIRVAREQLSLDRIHEGTAFGTLGSGDYCFQADRDVARYIESHTEPSERVFVWGFEPVIYFLAHRDCASRFIYNYPLYGDFPWQAYRDALIPELEASSPRYVVIVRNDAIPWVTATNEDSAQALQRFPALQQLLVERYQLDTNIEDMTLYRRID
ncbi:MAG: ArnT family glycosyltransferase [Anaerolineae bacterium]